MNNITQGLPYTDPSQPGQKVKTVPVLYGEGGGPTPSKVIKLLSDTKHLLPLKMTRPFDIGSAAIELLLVFSGDG